MAQIHYLIGDATRPQATGHKIIAHICNDVGGWGKGFVVAISKRWPEPEREYRRWHGDGEGFALGEIQLVEVEPDVQVANMIGQHGLSPTREGPPIRYEAVESCLAKLAGKGQELSASIHMPRIGCGLAGGTWDRIEPLIERTLVATGVEVFVYDIG